MIRELKGEKPLTMGTERKREKVRENQENYITHLYKKTGNSGKNVKIIYINYNMIIPQGHVATVYDHPTEPTHRAMGPPPTSLTSCLQYFSRVFLPKSVFFKRDF